MRNSLLALGFFLVTILNLSAQTRLGLHYTAEELTIWRQRANSGPYKSAGDAGTNSPGDWNRILSNANQALSLPSTDVWNGPDGSGCVQQWAKTEPHKQGILMRDAAFAYLITQNTKYADAAKKALLNQVSKSGTDFSNRSRWCDNVLHDVNPGFIIAEWALRVAFTYDYVKSTMTTAERDKVEAWIRNAGLFFQRNQDADLAKLYVNKAAGDYTLKNTSQTSSDVTHYNGYKVYSIHKYYNNRRSTIMRFYGLAGVLTKNTTLISSAKAYVREWLMFGVFPDGTISDFERWESSFADKGWNYATTVATDAAEVADALARTGDTELMNFTTSKGAYTSAGGQKNIRLVLENIAKHMDGTYKRYASTSSTTSSSLLIDGVNGTWQAVNDVWFSQPNVYYKSSYLTGAYTRRNGGTRQYPSSPASQGANHPWSGAGAAYPGVLFMFGQMEGKVNPYSGITSGTIATTTTTTAPTTTTTTTAPTTTTTTTTTTAPTTTTSSKLYRAINFNGTAQTIDGIAFESKAAANVTYSGRSFENQTVALNPSTDAARSTMIRSSIWERNGALKVNVASMPKGQYDVFFYTWEDNASEAFSISLEGKKVLDFTSGTAGKWKKHGPYRVDMSDGTLNLTTAGGAVNLSGIEIRVVTTTTSIASTETAATQGDVVTDIQVYPNPFTSKIAVQIPATTSDLKEVSITNKAGRTVYEEAQIKADKARRFDFDLASSNLPKGTYLLKMVFADGKEQQVKMYKQ
ncbi:T9SS type A sorting domain-containing protein [Pontibacter vulgaris]|uniref:T9SS type A sorting domain-containing protein n=1 Tax=Pontibacter vulgaris TaxID=2905679 RepID=UPI001FA7C803|nr:T9SS type A sorting domain-containing protein [Pontibacter vulgaris]